jgi:hypothetical protein
MEKIISKMVCNPKELYGFSFSQKIQILKAIIPPDKVDFIRHEALLIVNQIRNQLAHRLEPKNIENLTRDLAKAAGSRECPPDSSLAFQLHRSISYLCGFLNGIEHSLPQAARK